MVKKKVTNPLKLEWDKTKGKLTRKCRVCLKEFTPEHWRQTICEDKFCKQGSFLKSHFEASKKRWETWLKEAKKRNISFS